MDSNKIIILTNNTPNRSKTVTAVLKRAGYRVFIVNKEREWLEISRRESPDLIINNISSKNVAGIELCRLISADEKLRPVPILMIGELSEESAFVVEALENGASDYLKFPLEPLILIRKVAQLIERKRGENIVGDREKYFRALIENGTDIITVVTLYGNIIYKSPSVENLLGYKPVELVGRNCFEFIHPDDHSPVLEYYKNSIPQVNFTLPVKYRFRHKNGSWRVLESVGKFVEDFSEEIVIIINSRDITRRTSAEKVRRRIEDKLVQSEARFKLALRTAKMIWWEWNPHRDEMILADNFPEIYGDQNIQKSEEVFALLHPDDKEKHKKIVRKAVKDGGTYRSEFRVIRKDTGAVVWLEETATAFLNEKGKVQKIVGIAIDITKRKRSENAVRESEEKFKAQYKGIPVPTYIWKKVGGDFILEDYNDVAEKVSRKYISKLVGMNTLQVFPDFPKIREAIKKCFDKKTSTQFEMPYRYKVSGETRQLDFNLVFIPPDSVMVYTHDVTEFRQTINSLRLSENRFQMVSRATNDVLWEWDLTTDSIWWNENFYSVFRYREENTKLVAEFWNKNIHPSDCELIVNGIKNILETGQNYWSGEYRFRRGDGSYAYVLDRGYVERDESGKAVKMIGAMADITERKQSENALRESKERLALAQQVAKIGSLDWNFQTNEIITSIQLENIYGAAENFNNSYSYWLKFVHPDDVAMVEEDMRRALIDGELSNEFRIITADGNLCWIQSHLKVFYDRANQPHRMVGVNMDITERKNSEEALQKSQEQLRQSQKLESVGRLAGGIAHDFNNMLTAINGYSDLILRGLQEDSPLRRKVIEIKKAGERSAELTQQLLAFSRRQMLQPKLIDLNQIISDMSQMLNRLIGEDIELSLDLYANICCVKADPGQLSQVIMNLVVNSRDAMPDGGKLFIKTVNLDVDEEYTATHAPMESGDYVMLSVEDTGTGIDQETLQYVFEPFFTTKKAGTGTGLGLSTVYGIVKQSGGYIWVDSETGKGTVFKVFLPRMKEEIVSLKTDRRIKNAPKGTETILLVEDEEAVKSLVCQILQTYGYDVIGARNGIEALELCRESKPGINLLITDVVMPQMNGRRLAEELAQMYPQMKILFTSGYIGDKALLDDTINLDKNFIPKPFKPDSLANKVRELLDEIE